MTKAAFYQVSHVCTFQKHITGAYLSVLPEKLNTIFHLRNVKNRIEPAKKTFLSLDTLYY